jgi:diacylglycerol O-acyltransferase / wax synthase
MKPLSALDTLFVTMDSDQYPLHGAGLMILDPSTSPEPYSLDNVRKLILKLLPVMTPLRRRLVEVPFGLTTPVWIEDPDFDIDRHLHRIAVPSPGGKHEIAELVSELGSLPLDWHRPLWDLWFIEGLADGKMAIFMKMHHCAIDGMGGVEMLFQMFTMEPDQSAEVSPTDTWRPEGVPSQAEMLIRSLPRVASFPVTSARAIADIGWALLRGRLKGSGSDKKSERVGAAKMFAGPRLPFNEVPSGIPHKTTSFATIEMTDVKKIREIHGCTVNDIAVAASTAAIRHWLIDHDALPDGPISAGNPVNTRTVDDKGLFENRFTMFAIDLPVHLADPVERLSAINAATTSAKAATKSSGTNVLDNVFQVLAPGFAELLVEGLSAGLGKRQPPPFNTLITNVQGPPIPLYLAGAKLENLYIQMMQYAGLSLIIAVMSYAGRMSVTITGHRENTPDIWSFPDEIEAEVARLLTAPPTAKE